MTSIFRFLLVLAIAIVLGIGVYYLVQAVPQFTGNSFRGDGGGNPSEIRPPRDNNNNFGGGERDRRERGFSLFGLVSVFGRFILFSGITLAAIITHRYFRKKPKKIKITNTA